MNRLTVANVAATGNLLRIHFVCSGELRRFFRENVFVAEYDTSIEEVPEALLVIPFLATVCPVAWACGADVHVKTVDEDFLHGLGEIKKTFQRFYPEMRFSGNIHADNIVKPDVGVHSKSMMLFSGGVDSLLTYVKHQKENPVLVVVNGADVALTNREGWNTVVEISQDFADQTGSKLRTIRTNFRSVLNELMLDIYYGKKIHNYWFAGIMVDLGFLTLCAPLTYIDKIGKLYLASGLTKDYQKPSGDHPDIDNNVKWAGTTAIHDGYEFSRQEKLYVIAEYLKATGRKFVIRTCWDTDKNANCSVCEKCYRTILGLELAGIDPNEYGYVVNANTFSSIKKRLEHNQLYSLEGEAFLWEDIQRHARPDMDMPHPEAKDLLSWLVTVDIAAHQQKTESAPVFSYYRVFARKYFPYPLYAFAKKVLAKIRP